MIVISLHNFANASEELWLNDNTLDIDTEASRGLYADNPLNEKNNSSLFRHMRFAR